MTSLDQQRGPQHLLTHRERSVFINCPFDDEFAPVFDAIVFSVICCGFIPRSSKETESVSTPRTQRISESLRTSKYSVHDLSRCRGEGESNYARFNMTLELGMAMHQQTSAGAGNEHDWIALAPSEHDYRQFVSDLAGHDLYNYDGSAEGVIPVVMSWLATRPEASQELGPSPVLAALPLFATARKKLATNWNGNEPWSYVIREAKAVGEEHGLIPVGL